MNLYTQLYCCIYLQMQVQHHLHLHLPLSGLTRAAAFEMGAHGITCNAICPGVCNTEMAQKQFALAAKAGVQDGKDEGADGANRGEGAKGRMGRRGERGEGGERGERGLMGASGGTTLPGGGCAAGRRRWVASVFMHFL